jgi:predicted RNA-binding Zn ribbon-like protein
VLREGDGYTWSWGESDDLARALWPIARGAVDVLTSAQERARLRECASDTCAWVFIDRTKNHSRRWCDMAGCGNRAKGRAFRARQKRTTHKTR